MLKLKTFVKKTRRGKIMKVVREHYLRDDLGCGIDQCALCRINDDSDDDDNDRKKSIKPILSAQPKSKCDNFPSPHLIVLDTNVILNEIDVLEERDGFTDVIILQTVLEEVRHRSSPVFKRLRDIIEDSKRRFYIFINEHHVDTYVERQPGESANDRNDRAIRVAAEWYQKHANKILGTLGNVEPKVVLLSNDVANRKEADDMSLPNARFKDYVAAMSGHSHLIDKLSKKTTETEFEGKTLYPSHLSQSEVNRGVKAGIFFQGTFYRSRTNFQEGTVNCDSLEKPVLIQGLLNLNRAFDGDVVAIELLPESEWSAEAEIILEDEGYDPGDTLDDESTKILEKSMKSKEVSPTGRVVAIVRRKWRQYCGILQLNPVAGSIRQIFVPAEKKIPKIRIETRQVNILSGQRIIVAVDAWPRTSRYPVGHFVRALGKVGDKSTENEVLLLEHDIPHSKFSEAVLDCLPELPWIITPEDERSRVDCRHLDICSVDPPGCTDIDDALHCRPLENGNFEVGVHIADVSHFIRPGTAIDKEAANRSTTVYLTDRRIDMVPELLSSNLCSLRGGVERFAFSCVWEMDPQANIVTTKFHKSIIKSKAAMTYEQAQNMIDDSKDKSSVAESLRSLLKLSKILKNRRIDKGALVLASSEIRFSVDSETADPIDVEAKKIFETNSMVEEFMLAANISAAEKIFQDFPDCAMLRRHPAPPPSNFDPLVKAGKQQGFEITVDTNKTLADSLDLAVDKKNPYFNTMLRMIATRCMMQAVYFASGSLDEPLFVHYGLAVPIYTHFTSPIRRYADVIVHRLLAASIGADSTYKELLDKRWTQNVANNINYRHRMAQYASRASVNLHTHIFFKNQVRDETGYILFIRQNAIQVLIPKYGLEGTLFLRDPSKPGSGPNFEFDDTIPTQTCGTVVLSLFQKVVVQMTLDQSNVQHEKLVIRLVDPIIPGFSVPPAEKAKPIENGATAAGAKRSSNEIDADSSQLKRNKN